MLLSIAGGSDLGLFEVSAAANLIQSAAHEDANIIFGTVIDDALGDEVRVTVIAAGFEGGQPPRRQPGGRRSDRPASARAPPTPGAAETPTPAPSRPGNGTATGTASRTRPRPARLPRRRLPVAPARPMPVPVPSRPVDDDLDVPDFLK